ncbi:recombinase family protein [Streptomyces sp. NPDC006430]|uniref:recombinase family protein n=1 Tax=Streptomyces sp. NPDC006430 TaxID=3154299 RepID=UPI0033B7554E
MERRGSLRTAIARRPAGQYRSAVPCFDTSTPVGGGILATIADLAQQESDMKSAYVSAAQDTVRRPGSHVSGVAPYGFTTEREIRGKLLPVIRLVPDPVEAPHVRDMAEWAADGLSASQIAKSLNEEGVPTTPESLGEAGMERLAARRARAVSEAADRPAWVLAEATVRVRASRSNGLSTRPPRFRLLLSPA